MYYKLRAGITKGAAQWAVRTVGAGESLLDVLSQCPGLSQWSRGQCRALSVHFARLREERGDWAVDRKDRLYAQRHRSLIAGGTGPWTGSATPWGMGST